MGLFNKKPKTVEETTVTDEIKLEFSKGDIVQYKDAIGFFLYEGEIFFKTKTAIVNVKTNESFRDFMFRTSLGDISCSVVEKNRMISKTEVTSLNIK